ncbi:MAG: type II toxin-antitoxin system RelE/ParE family toxin [Synergistaceae bacterium]|nr:type II toxin-antitoxin system RelE/ParE family toxin [Synergistaceae bacterium]
MIWSIKLSKEAENDLKNLDKITQKKIYNFLNRLPLYPSPRSVGSSLKGNHSGKWRYRVGDYRIICRLHDDVLIIEAIKIGHRSKIYE